MAPAAADAGAVRDIMAANVGVLRDGEGLRAAITALLPLATAAGPASDPATVALMIVVAAWLRRESRGGHCRIDFPARAANAQRRSLRLAEVLDIARDLTATVPSFALRS
jgi:L-aspartate oxidase